MKKIIFSAVLISFFISCKKESKDHQLQLEKNTIKKVKVLSVGSTIKNAVKPTQSYIETNEYPFVRKIYLLNYQGRTGLGMGLASFVKSEVGQRIALKSGLAPVKIPTREIRIVKNNKKK